MQVQTSVPLFIYKSKYSINVDILPRKKELSSEVVAQPTQQVKAGDSTTFVFFQQHPVLFGHTSTDPVQSQAESPIR